MLAGCRTLAGFDEGLLLLAGGDDTGKVFLVYFDLLVKQAAELVNGIREWRHVFVEVRDDPVDGRVHHCPCRFIVEARLETGDVIQDLASRVSCLVEERIIYKRNLLQRRLQPDHTLLDRVR